MITAAITSQYQAALAMFRCAVRSIPAARWNNPVDPNPAWRVAYHALYFTHLYLSGAESAFVPWARAMEEAESLGDPFVAPADAPVADGIYSTDDILEYADAIETMLPELVPIRPYDGPSGYSWIRISRFEHHIYTIRHLQHHTGQLFERARASGGEGLEWTGRGSAARIVMEEEAGERG